MKKTGKKTGGIKKDANGFVSLPKVGIIRKGINPNEGFQKTAGSSSTFGAANVTQGPTFFYTPELTPESWLLPKSRQEVIKWVRIFFNLEPYIQSILMMHARYPFSRFSLTCDDQDALRHYERAISSEEFDMYEFLLQASLSYWKFGEFIAWGNWNKQDKNWNNFILLDPDLVEVTQDPLTGQKSFQLVPTVEIKRMVKEAIANGKSHNLPPAVVSAVLKNKRIPLDGTGIPLSNEEGHMYSPPKVSILARVTDPGSIRGTPPIQCLAGDTKVALLDGTNPTIEELYTQKRENFEVHSFNEKGEFVPGLASKVVQTGVQETLKITLDNGESFRCTSNHLFMTRDGKWKRADELAINESLMPRDREVASVEKGILETVYDVESVSPTHAFCVAFNDGSKVVTHNCLFKTLIYQDKIRLAQIAIADKHHLPIELWTVGSLGTDADSSILPDEQTLQDVRDMIRAATAVPPFSIVYSPLLKYEALSVSGKLLSIYEDLGFVENQILVGLGVNKNLILGEGPSFSNMKAISLHRLIMEYMSIRDQFETWMRRYVFLPIAKAHGLKDEHGRWILPNVIWHKSLDAEREKEDRDEYYKFWKDGLISTETLFTKMPDSVNSIDEARRIEKELGTIFDKGDKRIPKKFKSVDDATKTESHEVAPLEESSLPEPKHKADSPKGTPGLIPPLEDGEEAIPELPGTEEAPLAAGEEGGGPELPVPGEPGGAAPEIGGTP